MQGRQGIEGTGRLLSRCPSAVKLTLLLSSFNSWWCIAYMWEGAAKWSTQLCRRCWVATGLSRWMGCSDPQGPGRGRESINPAKMKLCPGCHNPFASSNLYKLFAVFFAFGWFGTLGIQSVEVLPSNFFVRQKWYVGILGKTCCSSKTKENQQQRENQNTKIHKQTTKQENQIINTQTICCFQIFFLPVVFKFSISS